MSDSVFRALGDSTRRTLLDRLRERAGQTLTELTQGLPMSRQAASQHIGILAEAGLVVVESRGRERIHHLNSVPIHELKERWIGRFDATPDFVYDTYIRASPATVWNALTRPEITARYWGHSTVSDWEAGSPWQLLRSDGSGIADVTGRVTESDRPRRLGITFGDSTSSDVGEPVSLVTFDIEPFHDIVRLTIRHTGLPSAADFQAAAIGWASVAANLKTLLETGEPLPQSPWEMHSGLLDEHLSRHEPRQAPHPPIMREWKI